MASPTKSFKLGNIQGSLFENEFQGNKSYTFSFQKSYKDKSGAWKYSNSYTEADLRNLYCLVGALINKQMVEKNLEASTDEPF